MTAKGLLASAVLLTAMAGLSAWGWLATPAGAEIPVHWNVAGEADRYGGKAEAFLLLPVLGVMLTMLFALAPKIDPRGRNLARSPGVLLVAWIGVLGVLTVAQGAMALAVTGVIATDGETIPRLILLVVGVLLVAIGNVLGKARPNWFVGVRTPWTLSSDKAWDVAHRWAGRGFVVAGLVGAVAALAAPLDTATILFVALALLARVGPMVLSYFVWRGDPDRETYSEGA